MPANSNYLTTSAWQRFAKISAGILGGYFLSAAIHLALAYWMPDAKIVLITSVFTIYLLWMVFLIVPFLANNGWKVWGAYLLVLLLCGTVIYFGKHYAPLNH